MTDPALGLVPDFERRPDPTPVLDRLPALDREAYLPHVRLSADGLEVVRGWRAIADILRQRAASTAVRLWRMGLLAVQFDKGRYEPMKAWTTLHECLQVRRFLLRLPRGAVSEMYAEARHAGRIRLYPALQGRPDVDFLIRSAPGLCTPRARVTLDLVTVVGGGTSGRRPEGTGA